MVKVCDIKQSFDFAMPVAWLLIDGLAWNKMIKWSEEDASKAE